jgi:hypothetical protein
MTVFPVCHAFGNSIHLTLAMTTVAAIPLSIYARPVQARWVSHLREFCDAKLCFNPRAPHGERLRVYHTTLCWFYSPLHGEQSRQYPDKSVGIAAHHSARSRHLVAINVAILGFCFMQFGTNHSNIQLLLILALLL